MTNPIVKITVKDFGVMTAELYPEKAPKTVANFVKLAESGFFSGLIFHRIIKGFMIQGGGYTEDMARPTRSPSRVSSARTDLPQTTSSTPEACSLWRAPLTPTPLPLSFS